MYNIMMREKLKRKRNKTKVDISSDQQLKLEEYVTIYNINIINIIIQVIKDGLSIKEASKILNIKYNLALDIIKKQINHLHKEKNNNHNIQDTNINYTVEVGSNINQNLHVNNKEPQNQDSKNNQIKINSVNIDRSEFNKNIDYEKVIEHMSEIKDINSCFRQMNQLYEDITKQDQIIDGLHDIAEEVFKLSKTKK